MKLLESLRVLISADFGKSLQQIRQRSEIQPHFMTKLFKTVLVLLHVTSLARVTAYKKRGGEKQLSTFSYLFNKYTLVKNPIASLRRLHVNIKFFDS